MSSSKKSANPTAKMRVVAIADVGKTHKKVFLIDEAYQIVFHCTVSLPETVDDDGDPCDDIVGIRQYILDILKELLQDTRWEVMALNFTTYGASMVYLNKHGEVLTPLYNYMKPYPRELMAQFYRQYGGEEKLCLDTASPALGSLNSGLQLYRLKHRKQDVYKKLNYALHLPQYLSYLITGVAVSDLTSIGCHTHLWDFNKGNYHDWVCQEGLLRCLPPVYSCREVMSAQLYGHSLQVGSGLHDSSSALIPYLQVFGQPFVLLSTGTWCITLNPFNAEPLSERQLKQDCLCYLSYQGMPVKASRLFTGHEHEQQVRRLARHFHKPELYYRQVSFDKDIFNHLLIQQKQLNPVHEGQLLHRFSMRQPEQFPDFETAYHCLMLDLVTAQVASSKLATGQTPLRKLFVDGGFGNNPLFMNMLAHTLPKMEVYAARVPQATALGAALAIHTHWNRFSVPDGLVQLIRYRT